MNKNIYPFHKSESSIIYKEMKEDSSIEILQPTEWSVLCNEDNLSLDKIIFKTKTPLTQEDLGNCKWFNSNRDGEYIRYSFEYLLKNFGKSNSSYYPCPRFDINFFCDYIKLEKEIVYEINGKEYRLPFKEAIELAIKRVGENKITKSIMNVISLDSYYSKEDNQRFFVSFIKDMSEYYFWRGKFNRENSESFAELKENYDEGFINYWAEEQLMSEEQLTCEHNDVDQYSEEGYWYNSVGTCKRCLFSRKEFDSEDCDVAFSAWTAALNYKKKN